MGIAQNLPDGSVTIIAEGEETSLRKLLEWCYRGSLLAKVEDLSFSWKEATGSYQNFSIDLRGKSPMEDKASALYQLSRSVLGNPHSLILPKHVVIIPDGNRRWAEEQNISHWRGHQKGAERVVELFGEIRDLGIHYLTLWGFSTENWSRDNSEINKLMNIFRVMAKKLKKEAYEHKVAVHHFGRKDRMPKDLATTLTKLEDETKSFSDYHFGLALDYGGRDEILRAFKKISKSHALSELKFSEALDTRDFPDPSLIIRTGGEQRLSGMMPWQSIYAELYFSPLYFPDFSPAELRYAIADYASRQSRFGN